MEHPQEMTMYALRRAAELWRPGDGDFDLFVGRALARAYDAWFFATRPGAGAVVNLKTDEHAALLGAAYSWGTPEDLLSMVPERWAAGFIAAHPPGSRVRMAVDEALEGTRR